MNRCLRCGKTMKPLNAFNEVHHKGVALGKYHVYDCLGDMTKTAAAGENDAFQRGAILCPCQGVLLVPEGMKEIPDQVQCDACKTVHGKDSLTEVRGPGVLYAKA
jgi:hypothetical protein